MEVRSAAPTHSLMCRRGLWADWLVFALASVSLAPYLGEASELVRMRNALLPTDQREVDFDWAPASMPRHFRFEQGPVDPFFVESAGRLRLAALSDDWQRALAISRHLLGSSALLSGGAIKSGLRNTYRRIVGDGAVFCGYFVHGFSVITRSPEQLGGIALGVHPTIRILPEPGNQVQRDKSACLRIDLFGRARCSHIKPALATIQASNA